MQQKARGTKKNLVFKKPVLKGIPSPLGWSGPGPLKSWVLHKSGSARGPSRWGPGAQGSGIASPYICGGRAVDASSCEVLQTSMVKKRHKNQSHMKTAAIRDQV